MSSNTHTWTKFFDIYIFSSSQVVYESHQVPTKKIYLEIHEALVLQLHSSYWRHAVVLEGELSSIMV